MAFDITSPVTGAAIAGFTSPSFPVVVDGALSSLQKQWTITVGGTQPGASSHSAGKPYTITWERPRQISAAAPARTGSNSLTANTRNKWKCIIRKGGLVNATLAIPGQITVRMEFDLPAGIEDASPSEIKSMMSFIGGVFNTHANSWSLSMASGTF